MFSQTLRGPGPSLAVQRRACRLRAFTLIEILVVVAIIALLLAILLPSLKAARDRTRRLICASNMRQQAIALNLYVTEFGYTVAHHLNLDAGDYPDLPEPLLTEVVWPVRLLRYLTDQHKVFWCPDAPEETLWNGKDHLVHLFKGEWLPEGMHRSFSYGLNDWGGTIAEPDTSLPYGLGIGGYAGDPKYGEQPIDRVKQPSEMIAIGDNDVDLQSIADDWFTKYGSWDTAIDPDGDWNAKYEFYGEYPGDRHKNGANIAFVDGHFEWYPRDELIRPRIRMRQRWNIDYRAHCDQLPDGVECE